MKKSEKFRFPAPEDRAAVLAKLRNLKMARSAHAYMRGSTSRFYDWLESATGSALPQGPPIWICGDCHLGNLGPIANAKGVIDIQIRDLDQTVIGNPAHDLIRLGLSLACAARGSDLPGVTTAKMLEQMMEGYEQAFADIEDNERSKIERPEAVKVAMRNALRRKWRHLAAERIENEKPSIPLGKHFWELAAREKNEIVALFDDERIRRLITSLRSRDDDASVQVQDAAFWVKGCSSLGRLRYAVLLSIGGPEGELCLIDVKEAVQAVAPHYRDAELPQNHAERVVTGAWHLSPALGERMLAATLQARPVFLRELLPQDLKFEIESLTQNEAMKVAKSLTMVVGKAHARQMDDATRHVWRKEMAGNRSRTLDAPSWLWSSVVELVASHEGEYLEHCRRYALSAPN